MARTIQIRVSEQEYAYIKSAFKDENLSKVVRDFLLSQAEQRIESGDVSLQADSSVQSFMDVLSNPQFQQMLYKVFKEVRSNG